MSPLSAGVLARTVLHAKHGDFNHYYTGFHHTEMHVSEPYPIESAVQWDKWPSYRKDLTTTLEPLHLEQTRKRLLENGISVVGGFNEKKTEKCSLVGSAMTCQQQEPELYNYGYYPELFLVQDDYCKKTWLSNIFE